MKKLKIILQYNYIFYILLFLALLFTFIKNKYSDTYEKIPNNYFTGVITSITKSNDLYKITIKNKSKIIGYYDKDLKVNCGDRIKVTGKFYEPRNNTIPNTFNYKEYLKRNKIYYLVKIDDIKLISKNKNIIYKIKNYLNNRSNNFNNRGYIKAFILGDKSNLDEYNNYQSNGVSHLFALSGMHISLLTGILYFLLRKIKYQNIFIIIFLIFYMLITDYSISLTRSVLFFIIIKINNHFDLNINTKNILILTISILLFYNPLVIYDYGFLYSSLVTYGLIISAKYYKKNYIYNLFITSLFAYLFSLPITLSLNYETNILSIINNIIIVPFVSLIIYPLSLITFIFPIMEPLLSFLIFILEKINYVLGLLSIDLIIPKVTIYFYLLYYLLLIIFVKSNNLKYLLFSILLVISFKLKILFNNTSIYYLDVGQGDSSLIINKNKVILIDTGGIKDKDLSSNTVKFLKSLGLNKINKMIITHGDFDHMGEAINLVNNFKVEKVIFNCGPYNDLEQELIKVLDKKNIKHYSCIKELNIDKNKLYFLQTKEYDNENDNSNVIYTEFDGYKFMFLGDASSTTENEIMIKYNLPNIDVLKVGHHGSKTSSSKEFIDEINPKYSIISVGKNNRYGHPNKEVLENLEDSKIYRTDQDGSIIFKIKNNKLKIDTCSP